MKTNNILTFLLISIFILASCRDNKMYFDEQSQSLVSLNDYKLRNLLFFNLRPYQEQQWKRKIYSKFWLRLSKIWT